VNLAGKVAIVTGGGAGIGEAICRHFHEASTTTGDQRLAADAGNFTAWLQAHSAGNTDLETLLTKRMSPDYKVAFDAWLLTDPFVNPAAPPGPAAMP
jgi:NAD(P)-dependent dehydrogenase (short-subunit alcohol dehydrogenase family)